VLAQADAARISSTGRYDGRAYRRDPRKALNGQPFDVIIMSYAREIRLAFYGPFRANARLVHQAHMSGDKKDLSNGYVATVTKRCA